MKKIIVFILCLNGNFIFAQDINSIINAKEVERIEKILSSDEMQGRRVFTPGSDKAAAFIANEFKETGLTKSGCNNSYLQEFSMVKAKFRGLSCTFDNAEINSRNVIVVTS